MWRGGHGRSTRSARIYTTVELGNENPSEIKYTAFWGVYIHPQNQWRPPLNWIKCPWNPGLRCYESDQKDCQLSNGPWMDMVDRWALTGRYPPASDWTTISCGRSSSDGKRVHWFRKERYEWDVEVIQSAKYGNSNTRDPKPTENRMVQKSEMYRLFDDADSVMGWIIAGDNERAPITRAICDDLKRAYRKWREGRRTEIAVGRAETCCTQDVGVR